MIGQTNSHVIGSASTNEEYFNNYSDTFMPTNAFISSTLSTDWTMVGNGEYSTNRYGATAYYTVAKVDNNKLVLIGAYNYWGNIMGSAYTKNSIDLGMAHTINLKVIPHGYDSGDFGFKVFLITTPVGTTSTANSDLIGEIYTSWTTYTADQETTFSFTIPETLRKRGRLFLLRNGGLGEIAIKDISFS